MDQYLWLAKFLSTTLLYSRVQKLKFAEFLYSVAIFRYLSIAPYSKLGHLASLVVII